MPVEFVIPDPINITVTQQSPSHDETDVVLRTELINVTVPGIQGPAGEDGIIGSNGKDAFRYIGDTEPDTSDWEVDDFWYDTSTE